MALGGGDWSASRPGCFIPMEIAAGTHWIGGCVSPRASLEISLAGFEPRMLSPQPVATSAPIHTTGPLYNIVIVTFTSTITYMGKMLKLCRLKGLCGRSAKLLSISGLHSLHAYRKTASVV
jgi:hypothetical protein